MKGFPRLALWGVLIGVLTVSSVFALEPGQSVPKRLYSVGDSATRAFDADLPLDNLNLSWVNGYFGFWQSLFGLPNVKSHNQRITANFGSSGRKNWIAAQNGAEIDDMLSQASGTADKGVTYATVLLGANDVCRDLPTDAEFEADFRAGMDTLLGNLPDGATVQVVAIFDVPRLHDIGRDKTVLGIVDCELVWALTGSCRSVLAPEVSDADREHVHCRLVGPQAGPPCASEGYNPILARVTAQKAAEHPGKFISFTDASFTYPFTEREVSDIDCFHPSWRGQKILSRETWNKGFFQAYQAGN